MSVALNTTTKKCFIYPEFRYPDTLYSKKGRVREEGAERGQKIIRNDNDPVLINSHYDRRIH